MEFGILGPLEVRADGRPVALGGARPRAVFAVLALNANQPVSAERLALALWGEDAPPSAVKTVQVYVARLRKALEDPDALVTTPAGYRLRVRPGELDAERFEERVATGRDALANGRAEEAAAELRAALALWRGPPLAELASAPFAPPEIARLEEQRLAAVEVRVDADLAAGRHAELVGELQQLTTQHPWRERLHAQLMLALYRSGRQADALEAYRHARDVLIGQLGIEPGADLNELQQAILAHDPALDAPPATAPPSGDRRTTLPLAPNRTIGRERTLEAIAEHLRADSVRLLTLVGPGGVGKTRLAVEAARTVDADFADGARFVSLAAVTRPEDVPATIVASLEIIPLRGEPADRAVHRFLGGKQLLLVVDNCEHLLAAAPFIAGVPAVCAGVTVLATSREPLSVHAEQRFPVSPLALPEPATSEDPETLAGVAAAALFCDRARAHDPGFRLDAANAPAVADICRRVDGLPLAIELATARCGLLTPLEIAERLDAALGALGTGPRDAPARHQTLRATVDWSHDRLSEDEKRCFARFAVFAGGATIDAAEAITCAELDTLDQLVAKSLLARRWSAGAPTRLLMLETIRAYASARLAATRDEQPVRARHYSYYLALAQRHGNEPALASASNREHLARLDDERDNLHGALRWVIARGNRPDALAMVAALGRYWRTRQRDADAVAWSDQALQLPGDDGDPAHRIGVLCIKARSLRWLGRAAEQGTVMAEAETAARRLGDPTILSQTLRHRADQEAMAGRFDRCEALADEALHWARTAGDTWEVAEAAYDKAITAPNVPELRTRVDWAAALMEEVGNHNRLARLLSSAAFMALRLREEHAAKQFVERAIPLTRRLDDPFQWMILQLPLAHAALLTGDTDTAESALREQLILARKLVLPLVADGLIGLAAIAATRGTPHRAARLIGAAQAHQYGNQPDQIIVDTLDARFLTPARTRYGADAWQAAVSEGAALSLEDAIAEALQEPLAAGVVRPRHDQPAAVGDRLEQPDTNGATSRSSL